VYVSALPRTTLHATSFADPPLSVRRPWPYTRDRAHVAVRCSSPRLRSLGLSFARFSLPVFDLAGLSISLPPFSSHSKLCLWIAGFYHPLYALSSLPQHSPTTRHSTFRSPAFVISCTSGPSLLFYLCFHHFYYLSFYLSHIVTSFSSSPENQSPCLRAKKRVPRTDRVATCRSCRRKTRVGRSTPR